MFKLCCFSLIGFLFASVFASETKSGLFEIPKPDPENFLREAKIFGADNNPIRTAKEDWGGAQQRAANSAEWKKWLDAQRAEVDDWMARRKDNVEWSAGWWHDFVSPKDGSFLTFTPDIPGEETLSSPSDPKVKLTPTLFNAWVYVFRSRHSGHMLDAARLFRVTGEKKYAEWAASQLDFYADNYNKFPPQKGHGGKTRLWWQTLDEATNLTRYAETARTLGDFVSPEQKKRWLDNFFKPEVELLNASFQTIHNIACWHRAAEGLVALYFDDAELWKKAVESPYGLRAQLAYGVTGDYLWYEQSMTYNGFVLQALLPFFTSASLKGRAGDLRREMAIAENLMLSPLAIRFPDGTLPNPADSTGGLKKAPATSFYATAYRVFPTALGLKEAAKVHGWETLIDPPEVPAEVPPLPALQSRNLESSRMAILRSGDWQVAFHYGQLHASHAQSEALNFEMFFKNSDVSHDPGTVGYGSPLHRDYYRMGLAHNVPLIEGHGQEKWDPGALVSFDEKTNSVIASQPNYCKTFSAERTLKIDGAKLIDIARLMPRDDKQKPVKLGLALHLQGKIILPDSFKDDAEFSKGRAPAFNYFKNPKSAAFKDQASFDVDFGAQKIRVMISLPGTFRVTHASAPDIPPRRNDALYIETTAPKLEAKTIFEAL